MSLKIKRERFDKWVAYCDWSEGGRGCVEMFKHEAPARLNLSLAHVRSVMDGNGWTNSGGKNYCPSCSEGRS